MATEMKGTSEYGEFSDGDFSDEEELANARQQDFDAEFERAMDEAGMPASGCEDKEEERK